MAELVLKLLGILFGVLARTLVPYLRKVKQGKVKKFWNGYWIQALASFALGIVTTLLIFPQFNVAKPGVGMEASVKLFCLAPLEILCNSIIAEAAKWTEKGKTK